MTQAVHYCGRQCIALRGHREETSDISVKKTWKLVGTVKLLAQHNIDLKQHIEATINEKSHITYLHHKHQNELVDIIGYRMIQQDVLDEVKRAGFYSIMVDESSSFNKKTDFSLLQIC